MTLVGNGRLAPSHVERAGTRRLYLDFPGVAAEAPAVTVVNQGPIERVRVALNSQKPMVTRVVIDLERPASHLVESVGDGREVKVTFREGDCRRAARRRARRRRRPRARRSRCRPTSST